VAVALLAAGSLVVLGGCSRKAEYNGIGPWQLGETTRAQSGGICSPEGELTWCHSNPPLTLGDHNATVDLYFAGHEPSAPLVEILLNIPRCTEGALRHWATSNLGKPSEEAGNRLFWSGRHAFIAAQVPAERSRCELNFVAATDAERIAQLRAGPKAED
jgi:hypothetical protein